jgi:hypothetical protein
MAAAARGVFCFFQFTAKSRGNYGFHPSWRVATCVSVFPCLERCFHICFAAWVRGLPCCALNRFTDIWCWHFSQTKTTPIFELRLILHIGHPLKGRTREVSTGRSSGRLAALG